MLSMPRQCRSMRAHAARRPNVFVLGAKPSLARGFAAASVRGPGRPTLEASEAASTRGNFVASGINLGIIGPCKRPRLVGAGSALVAVLWTRVV